MYKITKVTDKDGNVKTSSIDEIIKYSPDMTGEILYKEFLEVGSKLCFLWSGDSGRMMRTSPIESISQYSNIIHITTMNTEYWLEEI